MICLTFLADGSVHAEQVDAIDQLSCTGFVVLQPIDSSITNSPPDPALISEFFSFGVYWVVGCYLAAFAVGTLSKLLRGSR